MNFIERLQYAGFKYILLEDSCAKYALKLKDMYLKNNMMIAEFTCKYGTSKLSWLVGGGFVFNNYKSISFCKTLKEVKQWLQ